MTTPAPFPPTNPTPWMGEAAYLVEEASAILRLQPGDPDIDRLGRMAYSVTALVASYLNPPAGQVPDWSAGVPEPVTDACINALVESYRRKDAPFGVANAWNPDGAATYVSRDWLQGVQMALLPYKMQFGFA